MSATTQPTTFSDLYTDLQNRVRAQTGVTAVENIAKRYINSALYQIAINTDYKLPWLDRRATLITRAPYDTGTASISTSARTTVTGASTLWNTAVTGMGYNNVNVGAKMIFTGSTQNVYRVSAVGGDTSITIADRYIEESALSAATYKAFEDEYALASDFLRPVDYRMFSDATRLALVSRREFNARYPRPNVSGRPRVACILDLSFSSSTTPVRKVQLYPYPDAVYMIPYDYITSNLVVTSAGVEAAQFSGDSDEPNMPIRFRHVIVLNALVQWYRDRRNDARSQEALALYEAEKDRMVNDQDVATNATAQIQPRISHYVGRARTPYRQRGGRMNISVNNSFDRMDDYR